MTGQQIAFILKAKSKNYNDEQIIGFLMLQYNIFYNKAKQILKEYTN